MKYDIRIKRKAQKSLSKIPSPFQNKIIEAIRSLSETPHPPKCKKLTARESWRIRIGDYRVIYEIIDNELIILIV